MKGKTVKSFKRRLFYGILPDDNTKTITFYCSRANYAEGPGIAHAAPLFIQDYSKLDPVFFVPLIVSQKL